MSRPVILTVGDDPHVSAAIARDLRSQYVEDYHVVRATSGAEALEVLRRLSLRDQPLALVAADQRMPGMTGTALLGQVREQAPDAKLVLLTADADTDAAIVAINDIGLDHYLLKPWDPPAERLYSVLDDLLGDWQRDHPDHTSDLRVVGHRWSQQSHATKAFLASNHVPYRWYDIERDEEGARLVELAGAEAADLPLVLVPEADALRAPTIRELAAALGLRTTAARVLYDVCTVGGGPAGLAAAVYAASEGLTTVVVEHSAPGGQAGTSASIENTLVILGPKLRPGVKVERHYAPSLPRVEAYPGELNQAWTNLIDNAVDAMDGVGTLRIDLRPGDADRTDSTDSTETAQPTGVVVVEMSDTGAGMPPEVMARAFEAFFTTKDVGRGTGLDLDIAQRIIVERHSGTISVASQPGATTFTVRLPARHQGSEADDSRAG